MRKPKACRQRRKHLAASRAQLEAQQLEAEDALRMVVAFYRDSRPDLAERADDLRRRADEIKQAAVEWDRDYARLAADVPHHSEAAK